MQLDAVHLRDFYRTSLGQAVRRQLALRIRTRWPRLDGLSVIGAGFAAPYLGSFRNEAVRIGCLMPARQGAVVWPTATRCHSVLVDEHQWPLSDNSVDRVIAVHSLEAAERSEPLLREMWRVLGPEGRLILIVPNRRGLWSRMDTTPFGHGLPFSRGQLAAQLRDALFTPLDWSGALYFPPLGQRILLNASPALERFGGVLPLGVAGVIIVEARKELMAPTGRAARARQFRVLRPVESGMSLS